MTTLSDLGLVAPDPSDTVGKTTFKTLGLTAPDKLVSVPGVAGKPPPGPLERVAEEVVPPIANFTVVDPIRSGAADVVGLARRGLDQDPAKFYAEREKSLAAIPRLPETRFGQSITTALGAPGELIGQGVKGASRFLLGPETTEKLGPAATVAGDMLPLVGAGLAKARGAAGATPRATRLPSAAAKEASAAGYVLPPGEISQSPGIAPSLAASAGGKIKTQQAASVRNQPTTTAMAADDLGVPSGTKLTPQAFEDIRRDAGTAYRDVALSVFAIPTTPAFDQALNKIANTGSVAAQTMPYIMGNPAVDKMVADLRNATALPPDAWLDAVRRLRHDARGNLRSPDPAVQDLSKAQYGAANAIDAMMDDHLRTAAATGLIAPDLFERYVAARQRIAKSYQVERATDSEGNVSARKLAQALDRGAPLTGNLLTIAKAGEQFPKSTQSPKSFGGEEPHSVLSTGAALASAAHGHPGLSAMIMARPAMRNWVLSDPVQNRMVNPTPFLTTPGRALIGGEVARPHEDDPLTRAFGQ